MSLFLPIVVLGIACMITAVYMGGVNSTSGTSGYGIGGYRPWRRVSAGICLLVALMYVVGVNRLSVQASPRTFALYWITILILIVWLCLLAIKDIRHTRRTLARWRAGSANLDGSPIHRGQESDRES